MGRGAVLVLGVADAPEFAESVGWLRARVDVDCLPDCASALAADPGDRQYAWIFFCQRHPGEHRRADVDRVAKAFPLSRLVSLTGIWSEGEGRTGRPVAGVWRLPAAAAPARLAAFPGFQMLPELDSPPDDDDVSPFDGSRWRFPRLLSESERLLAECQVALPFSGSATGLVAIVATSRVTYETLADAVTALGFATGWELPGKPCHTTGATWVLWDLARGDDRELASVTTSLATRRAGLVLSWGGVRPEDREWARGIEAERGLPVRVIAKPWRLAELAWCLSPSRR